MKAKLTLVYLAEVTEERKYELEEASNDYDDQFILETFGIGWIKPTQFKVEFEE